MARPSRVNAVRQPAASRGGSGGSIGSFVSEVIGELKKVTWPSRPETSRLTVLVIGISGTIGIALGLIDMGFSRIFQRFIEGLFPF